MEEQKEYYSTREVMRIFGISENTICRIEAEGLIRPRREAANRKLYSLQDLDRLRMILALSRELGVNWAGVEVILHMRERMVSMQRQIDQIFNHLHRQMEEALERKVEPTRERRRPKIEIIRILDEREEE